MCALEIQYLNVSIMNTTPFLRGQRWRIRYTRSDSLLAGQFLDRTPVGDFPHRTRSANPASCTMGTGSFSRG